MRHSQLPWLDTSARQLFCDSSFFPQRTRTPAKPRKERSLLAVVVTGRGSVGAPLDPSSTRRLFAGASDSSLAQSPPQASTNWTCWALTSWKACAVRNRVHQSAQVLQALVFLASLQSEVGGTAQADRAVVRPAAANSRRAFEPDVSARMVLGQSSLDKSASTGCRLYSLSSSVVYILSKLLCRKTASTAAVLASSC